MAQTIAARMSAGRTTGFDYLRFGLAASIILWHGLATSYGATVELTYWRGPAGVAYHFVLPMFFALSGFLVAGSLDRCPTLLSFFGLRVLRIVPALAVEITLSALVFGPLLTSLPLADYFSSPVFARYFLNILGNIHFLLPGLFADNPLPATVNAQLWTIPYELMCYLSLGGLAVSGLVRRRFALLILTAALQALWAWQAIRRGDDGSSNGASGEVLIVAFLTGILFHLYRDRIVMGRWLFACAVVAGGALSALPHGAYYLCLPATYATVYLGLLNPRQNRFLQSGDYSYGMFLYGYPIQQAFASIGPAVHHWWLSVCVCLPAALGVAALSWHRIERPALAWRNRIPPIEAAIVRAVTGGTASGALATWPGRLAAAAIACGGPLGTILLVDGHEMLGVAAILGTFTAAAFWASRVRVAGRLGRETARPA